MSDFKKFKEELRSKEKFYSSLKYRKITDKNMNIFLMLCLEYILNKKNEKLSKFAFKM